MPILFDSSVLVPAFRGVARMQQAIQSADAVSINMIVLGELLVGVHRVSDRAKADAQLQDFLELTTVLELDHATARIYGEITAELPKKGKPLPTNDVWIAASAVRHGLTLVAADAHFSEIPDLRLKLL